MKLTAVVIVAGLIRLGAREGIVVLPAGVAFVEARILEVVQAPLGRVRQDAVRAVVVFDPEGQEETLALLGRAVGRAVFLDHGNVGVLSGLVADGGGAVRRALSVLSHNVAAEAGLVEVVEVVLDRP